MTPEEIKSELKYFTGSENYYKFPFNIMITDGVKFLADSCQCYWLITNIASYQLLDKVKSEPFQVYKMTVKDHSAIINIEDGNNHVIASYDIPFTDFPLEEIELWFSNNVLYLPSEH